MKIHDSEWSPCRLVAAVMLTAVLAAPAAAQTGERSGKDIVNSVCAKCHASGERGAPKIGDKQAWRSRAEQGLGGLTQHVVTGVRKMPAHGGAANLTDLELARAVTYMVNQSGGRWTEPASAKELAAVRTGQQVVQAQCVKCHKEGLQGAPRIGDREAWAPRLKQGLDLAVRSAIRGHGGMPARGDRADLTDGEIQSAILYMFNPGAASKGGAPASAKGGASGPGGK